MKYRQPAWPIGIVLLLLTTAGMSAAQDSLASVKTLYASAAYEDALSAIDRLRSAGPAATTDSRGLEQYRAFCLLALGRDGEATQALEQLITADPFFTPDQNEVSPRVFTLFHTVRRRLLGPLVQQKYAMAKATYDRKEYGAAVDQFTRVAGLIDDPDMDQKTPGLADLRVLAGGFLDLAKNAAAPPKPPAPVADPAPPPPPKPVKTVFDAGDPDVAAPVTVRQDVPPYPVQPSLVTVPIRPGVIEIVIDESGRVERAVVRQSISGLYDPMVLSATTNWRYKPALRNGVPVKYRKLIQISVEARK